MNYEYILLEGQIEDLVARYPKLQDVYDAGLLDGMRPAYVQWIAKQEEPPEDVIDLVNKFEKSKQRLAKKDINQYDSGELALELEQLGQNEKKKTFSSSKEAIRTRDTTVLGQFGPWLVVMPHTTESSCYWANRGGQVSWCTARTQSQNLFLSYVANGNHDIILYYLLNTEEGSSNDDYKISIGFQNGNLYSGGGNGGLTVNSRNKGLTDEDLETILGPEYESIMYALEEHSQSIKGKHPAKKELLDLAKDLGKFRIKFETFKGEEELSHFVDMVMDMPSITSDVLKFIFEKRRDRRTLEKLYSAKKISPDVQQEVIEFIAKTRPDDKYVQLNTAFYSRSSELVAEMVDEQVNKESPDMTMVAALIDNKTATDYAIKEFMKVPKISENSLVKLAFARSSSPLIIPQLPVLARDRDVRVREEVARNGNTPPEVLLRLSNDGYVSVTAAATQNRNFKASISKKLEHRVFERLLRESKITRRRSFT